MDPTGFGDVARTMPDEEPDPTPIGVEFGVGV